MSCREMVTALGYRMVWEEVDGMDADTVRKTTDYILYGEFAVK